MKVEYAPPFSNGGATLIDGRSEKIDILYQDDDITIVTSVVHLAHQLREMGFSETWWYDGVAYASTARVDAKTYIEILIEINTNNYMTTPADLTASHAKLHPILNKYPASRYLFIGVSRHSYIVSGNTGSPYGRTEWGEGHQILALAAGGVNRIIDAYPDSAKMREPDVRITGYGDRSAHGATGSSRHTEFDVWYDTDAESYVYFTDIAEKKVTIFYEAGRQK